MTEQVEFERPDEKRRVQLLTLPALADRLGTYRQRIYQLVRQGKIRIVELDGVRGVDPDEVKRLLSMSAPMVTSGGRKVVRFSSKLGELADDEI